MTSRALRPEFESSFGQSFSIESIVLFRSLLCHRESVGQIARIELQAMAHREGFSSRNLNLKWDDDVIEFLVRKGYSKKLGARPLQRAIEQEVSVRIARILATRPRLADSTLAVSVTGDDLKVDVS